MLSGRKARRALYGVTGIVFTVCSVFAVLAIQMETVPFRVGFMLSSVWAGALATASLFAAFVAPLERVYRHGYEAGQHSCQQTDLRMVIGQRSSVVVPFRERSN